MKKIESLNNARKTVLKLEKEISAISTNLSKVKNKDHSTMKKIINNINYLLTKEAIEKNINKKDINYEIEENKQNEEYFNIRKSNKNQYHNSDRNIDYLLLYNKQKNKNNNEKNTNLPYFNRKCYSSSKINIDVNNNNYSNEHNLFKDYKSNVIKNKNERMEDSNKNKIINYSCNHDNNLYKTNLMAYSKPKLNSKNKNVNQNSTPINSKNNSDKIRNVKYFSLNGKNRKNKDKEPSILNTLYYNYKDNNESNILKNNFFNEYKKKIAFSYEEPEMYDTKNNKDYKFNKKEEYKHESKKDIISSINSNKKLILEKKIKKNQDKENVINHIYNNYDNFNHQSNLNYLFNNHKKNYFDLDEDNLSKITSSEKIIKNEKNNYINSYENQNGIKSDDSYFNDNNYNSPTNYISNRKVQDSLKKNRSQSFSPKSIFIKNNFNTETKNTNGNNQIDKLLNMLNANNINDAILRVNNLLKSENDLVKLKQLYNNGFNLNNKNYEMDFNFSWLSKIIKKYKSNENYRNYCKNIMMEFKIKKFEDFKKFIKDIINNKKKSDNLIHDTEEISVEDEYYLNNKNSKNFSDVNYNKGKNYNIQNNGGNMPNHNNNIQFSNPNEFKIITEYMNTYY
jgi:hypothetical protein